jgi:hypothetical protein
MELSEFQGGVDWESRRFGLVIIEEEGSWGFEGRGKDMGCVGGNRQRRYFGGVSLVLLDSLRWVGT